MQGRCTEYNPFSILECPVEQVWMAYSLPKYHMIGQLFEDHNIPNFIRESE